MERLTWYENRVRNGRRSNYGLEGAIIVVSAAVPATAAAGGSIGLAGILGAVVTALVGVRQLVRFNTTWSRVAATVVAMQREVVLWSVSAAPYDTGDTQAAERLATAIEALVVAETTQWTDQRASVDQALIERS